MKKTIFFLRITVLFLVAFMTSMCTPCPEQNIIHLDRGDDPRPVSSLQVKFTYPESFSYDSEQTSISESRIKGLDDNDEYNYVFEAYEILKETANGTRKTLNVVISNPDNPIGEHRGIKDYYIQDGILARLHISNPTDEQNSCPAGEVKAIYRDGQRGGLPKGWVTACTWNVNENKCY